MRRSHRFDDLTGIALVASRVAAALAATLMLMLTIASSAFAESGYSFDATPGKLPKSVIPVHYAIELTPDLGQLTLAGT
jgi:aminopeptidase N